MLTDDMIKIKAAQINLCRITINFFIYKFNASQTDLTFH